MECLLTNLSGLLFHQVTWFGFFPLVTSFTRDGSMALSVLSDLPYVILLHNLFLVVMVLVLVRSTFTFSRLFFVICFFVVFTNYWVQNMFRLLWQKNFDIHFWKRVHKSYASFTQDGFEADVIDYFGHTLSTRGEKKGDYLKPFLKIWEMTTASSSTSFVCLSVLT